MHINDAAFLIEGDLLLANMDFDRWEVSREGVSNVVKFKSISDTPDHRHYIWLVIEWSDGRVSKVFLRVDRTHTFMCVSILPSTLLQIKAREAKTERLIHENTPV